MRAEDIGVSFASIGPGEFTMGSPVDEIGREPDERQHKVVLTRPFKISKHPVTVAQFRVWRPDHFIPPFLGHALDRPTMPVTRVSLDDAFAFASWLSTSDPDWTYLLPSEAEWEYAARAGSTARFFWGEDESGASKFGNLYDQAAMRAFPHLLDDGFQVDDGFAALSPVGSFQPNSFDLFDVLGNVWEMCRTRGYKYPEGDLVDPQGPSQGTSLFAVRGGDWLAIPFFARLANRTFVRLGEPGGESVGFRIVAYPKQAQPLMEGKGSGEASAVLREARLLNHGRALQATPSWDSVRALFTDIDVEHMRDASAKWKPPLDLSDYDSVVYHAVKVYSSLRNDRMPVPPTPKWSREMKRHLRDWIYLRCPR